MPWPQTRLHMLHCGSSGQAGVKGASVCPLKSPSVQDDSCWLHPNRSAPVCPHPLAQPHSGEAHQ